MNQTHLPVKFAGGARAVKENSSCLRMTNIDSPRCNWRRSQRAWLIPVQNKQSWATRSQQRLHFAVLREGAASSGWEGAFAPSARSLGRKMQTWTRRPWEMDSTKQKSFLGLLIRQKHDGNYCITNVIKKMANCLERKDVESICIT